VRTITVLSAAILALIIGFATAQAETAKNFNAHLAGRDEVPPVDTKAQGEAILRVSDDGTSIHYKLIAGNIDNLTAAHIHCGAAGVAGPVVVPLPLGPGARGAIIGEGDVSAINPVPSSAACPGGVANMADLLMKIEAGMAYVNVHTVAHPGGEIRGQLR
jgi:hypothetical protein